jgi:hypothetical protein
MPTLIIFKPFTAALVTFLIFIGLSLILKTTSTKAASQNLCKLHFILTPLYFFIAWWIQSEINSDLLVGLFFYFGFHYLGFLFFFGILRRSFSVNLCISILESGNKSSSEELKKNYAGGKGISFVKQTRIQAMLRNHLIEEKNGKFTCTRKGKLLLFLKETVLSFWGLTYINLRKELGTSV